MTGADSIFSGGGESGRVMSAIDWAATPLGPVGEWPQSLRSAVRIALRSRYPILLTWGPQYIQLYNDAYSQLIGDKHPEALGTDVRITMAEGWGVLGPLVDQAMGGGEATWVPALQLLLERAGYREEAYFTVSHGPLADDEGRPAGMFAICSEVTEQVIGERRQRLLRELPARAGVAETARESLERVLDVLGEHPLDVPFAAAYLREEDRLRLVGTAGLPDGGEFPAAVALAELTLLEDVARRIDHTGGPGGDPVTCALTLPLATGPDGQAHAVLVAATSPGRALDEGHRAFFELLAAQVSGVVRTAAAYEEERRRVEALAALDQAKNNLFSGISHEFRTPLTLLLGPLADALTDTAQPLAGAQRERVELAARNARRMRKLVDALLDFSRLQGGALEPQRRLVDVSTLTADVASVFRAAVERAGLRYVVESPPTPPVAIDPDMWEHIVLNLVSNAFKHTFTGEIRVGVREEGDRLLLEVADTGIGIAPDELPRLFERFHRVMGTQARTHEGAGIGLALVKDLVEAHEGTVGAVSRPGEGSTFTVAVPKRQDAAPAEAARAASERAALAVEEVLGWDAEGPGAPAAAAHRRDERVLVVDDNADMRAYVARLLEPVFEVRTARDGQAALEAVRADPPDIVLTDVMMPRLDGFGLLAALRADDRTAAIPVVLLTARSGPEAAIEGLRRGADDYVAKPFTSQELLARVEANVARGARQARVPSAVPPAPLANRSAPAPSAAPGPVELGVERAEDELRIRMPALAEALALLRRELRPQLQLLGLDQTDSEGLVLAACEAVTNALEHAQDATRPYIDVTVRPDPAGVAIEVRDFGRWRPRGASLERGRGSTLMEALADVRVFPTEEGTLVTLRTREKPAA